MFFVTLFFKEMPSNSITIDCKLFTNPYHLNFGMLGTIPLCNILPEVKTKVQRPYLYLVLKQIIHLYIYV